LIIHNLELARRINDSCTFCNAAVSRIFHASAPRHSRARLALAEELAKEMPIGLSAVISSLVAAVTGHVFLEFGLRQRAEKAFDRMKETAERSGQVHLVLMSGALDCLKATMDGRLEDALEVIQNIRARGEQLGLTQFAGQICMARSFMPFLYMGRIDAIVQQFASGQIAEFPIIRANIGSDEEAAEILDQWVVARPGIGSIDDETPYFFDVPLLQAALRIAHRRAVELLLQRLAGSGLCTTGILFTTCIPRHLGAAAALLGRPEEARKHYDEALRVTTEMRFQPELALTRLQLAELLREPYPKEKDAAKEHLDFAIKEFREMKMQPALDRASALV